MTRLILHCLIAWIIAVTGTFGAWYVAHEIALPAGDVWWADPLGVWACVVGVVSFSLGVYLVLAAIDNRGSRRVREQEERVRKLESQAGGGA